MNARTKLVSSVASIVLGLALSAGAAEPPKPESVPDLDKLVGQPVDGRPKLVWKRAEVLIEWGFKKGTEALPFDGSVEATQVAMVGVARPLSGDTKTAMTGDRLWKSPGGDGARRGIVVPVLYTAATRGPERSIVTVRTTSGSFSFQPVDLEAGPILAPEYGFFVALASANVTAEAFQKELAAKGLKTIRQRVQEMPEQTWERAMVAIHGKREWPPFPKVPYEPKMNVQVPCPYLTGLWRIGAWQIVKYCGPDKDGNYRVLDHPFGPIALEVDRILWALDHLGMHKVAADGMGLWLNSQKSDGMLLTDHGHDRKHAMGALLIPWVMAEHYRLTGDLDWLKTQAPRLKAAGHWILERRRATMKDALSPQELEGLKTGKWSPYGLQLPIASGDGDPSGARYWFWADTFAYQSVVLLAGVLAEVDAATSAKFTAEAEKYRKDLRKVIDESIALAPVIKTQDAAYRSFFPPGFQDRGPLIRSLPESANLFSHCGPYSNDVVGPSAAIEACVRSGLLRVDDPRLDGCFNVIEDVHLYNHPWFPKRKKDYSPEKDWFDFGWGYQTGWERLPDFYLFRDDIPNFLRAWLNRCAVDMNLSNWTFNEHTTFAANDKSHGNAVFLSNFRNMLVMEIDDALWLARATPRAWLEQGKKIAVKNAPTHFGTLAYEMVSDADHGKINATIEMPARKAPKEVVLRFRHPKAAPIKGVTVNGKPWTEFNKDKETITLKGLTGTVAVTAQY